MRMGQNLFQESSVVEWVNLSTENATTALETWIELRNTQEQGPGSPKERIYSLLYKTNGWDHKIIKGFLGSF